MLAETIRLGFFRPGRETDFKEHAVAQITFKGKAIQTSGDLPRKGQIPPPFTLVRTDLSETGLDDYPGRRVVLNIFPSLDNLVPASCFRSSAFGEAYGIAIMDGPMRGLLARSVVVVDEKGVVIHTELVPDIGQEPDYNEVEVVLK
jgi:thiol peroxidase